MPSCQLVYYQFDLNACRLSQSWLAGAAVRRLLPHQLHKMHFAQSSFNILPFAITFYLSTGTLVIAYTYPLKVRMSSFRLTSISLKTYLPHLIDSFIVDASIDKFVYILINWFPM